MSKIKLSVITVACSLLLFSSCKKEFLDINDDPNRAIESNITPDLAMALQLHNTAARNASSYDFLQRWLGYWSASGSYSRSTVEMSYNITNDFGAGIWNGIYYSVSQYKSIEKKANEGGMKFYEGISMIMQAFEVGNLVDVYGNVPYSKAWDLIGNINPAYDNAEDVYKALIPQIDAGLALIKAAAADANITTQDIIFQGNKTKWAKFANTVKLKLLLHTSKTTTFNRSAEIAKIVAEGSGFLGSGVGAMTHPGLVSQPGYTADKPNPAFNAHLFLISTNEADNYNRANNFTLNLMKTLLDERYKRVYREAKNLPGQFRGTDYGQNPADDLSSDRTSGPGYGLAASSSSDMWIMTSVEAMFHVAEATARGWLAGNAKDAYENAVKESFTYLAVPNATAAATTYLTSVNPRITWPADQAGQISVVMWQKYFALTGIQANETWVDIRRTGIVQPPLSLAPERGSNPIPRRLLYPTQEYQYNKDNAPQNVSQFTSKIFWDL